MSLRHFILCLCLAWSHAALADVSMPETPGFSELTAEERYESEAIHFELWASISRHSGAVLSVSQGAPLLGKYNKPLSYPDFYRRIGEPSTAERLEREAAVQTSYMRPGGILIGVGLLGMLSAIIPYAAIQCPSNCDTRNQVSGAVFYGSIGLAGLGITLAFIGGVLGPKVPHTQPELAELADRYNKGLRKSLGLETDTPKKKESAPDFTLAPTLTPSFAGLMFAMRF